MTQISVIIPDSIFLEMEGNLKDLHVSKNQYILDGIKEYNLKTKMITYAKQLKEDSLNSRDLMKSVLSELDAFVGDIEYN